MFCRLIVLWASISISIKSIELTDSRRVKRVVNGEEILVRNSSYNAVLYYVFISNKGACKEGIVGSDYVCDVKSQNLVCGGSLLTPNIVQTACTCVASFSSSPGIWKPGKSKSEWETNYFIFPGRNDVRTMTDGLRARKVYVHEKCAQMRGDRYPRLTTHDTALIVLQSRVDQGAFTNRIKYIFGYADLFTKEDLKAQWEDSMFRLPTCMALGFGFSYRSRITVDDSWVLRHSWASLREYWRCYYYTMMDKTVDRNGTFNYTEMATWGCMANVQNKTAYPTVRDQGGPVTCNNYYYGIHSASFDIIDGLEMGKALQLMTPIAFTPCENSAEFRQQMIAAISNLKDCDIERFKFATPSEPAKMYFSFVQLGSSVSESLSQRKLSLEHMFTAVTLLNYHLSRNTYFRS